jgi:hypothetical protein
VVVVKDHQGISDDIGRLHFYRSSTPGNNPFQEGWIVDQRRNEEQNITRQITTLIFFKPTSKAAVAANTAPVASRRTNGVFTGPRKKLWPLKPLPAPAPGEEDLKILGSASDAVPVALPLRPTRKHPPYPSTRV